MPDRMPPPDPDPDAPPAPEAARALPTLVVAGVLLLLLAITLPQCPAVHGRLLATEPITWRIDANTAGVDELCLLPGVGPATARKLIRHREAHGPFAAPADLEQVSGIGEKTRAAMQPWITLEGQQRQARR